MGDPVFQPVGGQGCRLQCIPLRLIVSFPAWWLAGVPFGTGVVVELGGYPESC